VRNVETVQIAHMDQVGFLEYSRGGSGG